MDFSAYTDLLWNAAHYKLKILVVVAVFCLIPSTIWFIRICLGKKSSKDLKISSLMDIAILAYILIESSVIPIIQDISGECYSSAHGEYTIEVTRQTNSSPRTEWIILISDDGEKIVLRFPKKGEDLIDIPEEGGSGTIWYSENSKCILDYIPDESIGDSCSKK